MKEYTGYRTPQGCVVTVHEPGREPQPLDLRLDTQSNVAWVGYANQSIKELVEPILQELLHKHGLVPTS